MNARRPEQPPDRTHLSPWTHRRAYAQCSDDPAGARPGFHPRRERSLLRELRDRLDIVWAALRTLRIGGYSSIGSPGSWAIESEPGSSRGLGSLSDSGDSRRHSCFSILIRSPHRKCFCSNNLRPANLWFDDACCRSRCRPPPRSPAVRARHYAQGFPSSLRTWAAD